MSEQDTMRLVAEVVDKYSGPLKDMNKSLRDLANVAKGSHEKAGSAAREHAKHMRELHERVHKVKEFVSDAFVPAMATMGISIFGVGEGLAKITESLKRAGENYNIFNDISKRSGQRFQDLEGWSLAFQRLGIDATRALPSLAEFGEHMDKLRRRQPQEMSAWAHAFGDGLQFLTGKIAGLHTRKEQLEAILDAFSKHPEISIDKRRKFYEQFGLPPEFATKTAHEIHEAIEKGFKVASEHPVNKDLMQDLEHAFAHLRESLFGFNNDMIETFGPKGVKVVEAFASAIEGVGNQLKKAYGIKAEVPFDKRSIFGRIAESLGMHATGGETKQQETIAKGTRQGFLDALREFEASHRTPANSFAGGYTPMAFHPDGGGGGAGGRGFGGGGFKVLPDGGGGSTGGGSGGAGGSRGDGGGGLPGMPTEGSNAFKGIGGLGGPGGDRAGINREKWLAQLNANPALKERLFRHSLGENTDPKANQAIMEEAANRADIRGNRNFDDKGNLRYFQGYYGGKITPKMRKMLEDNFRKVFVDGSDIAKGAIDNSSQWLSTKHERNGRFKTVANFGGDGITGHRGVESFQVPGWGESGRGERDRYGAFRRHQLEEAAERRSAARFNGRGASLRDHIRNKGSVLDNARKSGVINSGTGGGQATNHHLQIDFNNMPKGTKTAYNGEGLFKEVRLNRGRSMPMASQDS